MIVPTYYLWFSTFRRTLLLLKNMGRYINLNKANKSLLFFILEFNKINEYKTHGY